MKIKTRLWFKYRRLAEHSQRLGPPLEQRLITWLKEKQYLLKKAGMERELFHSCMMLKNLAIVHQSLPMSTDFLLEQLMESSQMLRPVYADILTDYRNGKQEEAFMGLYQKIPISSAQKLSRILCRLDDLQPAELVGQMNAFEESFAAEQKTKAMARAERKSLITTLASTATIFVVLLNFVVVVVFLDTLEVLSQLY